MKITYPILIIIILFPGFLFAQQDLARLTQLEGTWTGKGFQQAGQQQRVEFTQKEEVTLQLGGNLIMIHGIGTNRKSGEQGFEAVGMMYYDQAEQQTYIHAWTGEGQYTRAAVEVTENGFEWGFDVDNGGRVKYVATITQDQWIEKGVYSPDNGTTWYPFMEMELSRN